MSGSSRSAWTVAALTALSATVVVLAMVATRLARRVDALEGTPRPGPAESAPPPPPAVDDAGKRALEERVAALERERAELAEENRWLRTAAQGRTGGGTAPGAALAEDAQALRAKGAASATEGRYADARWQLGKAVALDATDARSWWLLSFASFATGAYRDAGEAFTRALRLGYRELLAMEHAPSLRFGTRAEYELYLRGLEKYVAANPQDLHARTLLAWHAYFERGPNYAQAALAEITQSPDGMEFEPAKTLAGIMR
jgi:hypothetical protein